MSETWIIMLRVSVEEDERPPDEWNWAFAPCSADASPVELLVAVPAESDVVELAKALLRTEL